MKHTPQADILLYHTDEDNDKEKEKGLKLVAKKGVKRVNVNVGYKITPRFAGMSNQLISSRRQLYMQVAITYPQM
jgi:hypothetical protein